MENNSNTAVLPEVRIHIDEHPHRSGNPTTHDELYRLGEVKPGLELFREVTRDEEDQPIKRGSEIITLKEDEHFHSGHPHGTEIKIFVNGREFVERHHKLTYEQVVALAYPNPDFEKHTYKVTYFRPHDKHEGTLNKGERVRLSNDMEFTVVRSDQS